MLENPVAAKTASANTLAAAEQPQVPLRVNAGAILASEFAFTQFQAHVGDMLSRGLPLAVTLAGLERLPAAADGFRQVCAALAASASASATPQRAIEVAIAAGALQPDEAWTIRSAELGPGPLYLLASEQELRGRPEGRAHFAEFWQLLWRHRTNRYLRLACAPLVQSACPLLADENAETVLPQSSFQVPSGSAWVTREIDLCDFADLNGRLDRGHLRSELLQSIKNGLARHEEIAWPNASLRHDSWLNRRLAILVNGIGDLVLRRQQNPRELACLASLRRTLRWIRCTLSAQSRQVALSGEVLPALGQFDPGRSPGIDRERWEARWAAALNEHASACRNLVVMSPWSVFPRLAEPDPAYLNLLPLLDFADACAFPEAPQLGGWNIKSFMQLYQRLWAVLERRGGAARFAVRV